MRWRSDSWPIRAPGVRTTDVNAHFETQVRRMDLRAGLANVRSPVLVVVGEHDILVPPHLAEELLQALPPGRGQLNVVADVSHDVLADNPSIAWPAIREFILDAGTAA